MTSKRPFRAAYNQGWLTIRAANNRINTVNSPVDVSRLVGL